MSDNILIKNGIVLPMNRPNGKDAYFTGTVGIENGKIAFVSCGNAGQQEFLDKHKGDCDCIDARGMLVMPGLINTHTHVAMSLLRGISDDVPLMEWLQEHIWPIEGKMGYKEIYDGARLGMLEMLLGGTTTLVDMYPFEEAVSEAAQNMGIRAYVSPCSMDFRMEHFEQDWRNVQKRFSDSSLVSMIMGPHAIYTLSEQNLKRTIELAGQLDTMYHVHLSETQTEVSDSMAAHGMSPVRYLESMGMFDRPTLAAHCVVMTDDDIQILSRHGVSVAHNPQSNMKLASGISPIKKMMDAGVNVALGTDGASSNNDLDMWDEMRTASLLQKVATMDTCAIPAYTALEMATVNGAKALGMEGRLGVLQEGAIADVILVNLEQAHLYPHTNLISGLVYSAHACDVDTVIVNGRITVRHRECLTASAAQIFSEAQQDIDRLMA